MKSRGQDHGKNGGHSVICALLLMGVLISALCLGSIRIYGFYLEHRLADCVKKIESEGDKYAKLEESHAALLSPSRIYNYARTELNMVAAGKTETIKLLADSYDLKNPGNAARVENTTRRQGWLSWIFAGAANATE